MTEGYEKHQKGHEKQQRGQLSVSERERLNRLRGEVIGRLTEAHLIMARALGQQPRAVTGMSIQAKDGDTAPAGHVLVEVIFADDGSAVCYYDPPGVCEPC